MDEDVRWYVERNSNATREVIQTVRAYEFYAQFLNCPPNTHKEN
jgi:hypothetical protein